MPNKSTPSIHRLRAAKASLRYPPQITATVQCCVSGHACESVEGIEIGKTSSSSSSFKVEQLTARLVGTKTMIHSPTCFTLPVQGLFTDQRRI